MVKRQTTIGFDAMIEEGELDAAAEEVAKSHRLSWRKNARDRAKREYGSCRASPLPKSIRRASYAFSGSRAKGEMRIDCRCD